MCPPEVVELLKLVPGDPVLTMTRMAYDTNGWPGEYGSHCYPAEPYWVEMMLLDL